jgi:Rrf2 family iron-sulfur cluster assembly transcriptional regulator
MKRASTQQVLKCLRERLGRHDWRPNKVKLTAKGRYAVTAMVDLAVYGDHGPISLSEISERQSISQPYLEQLFAKLKANHLVLSVRGPGGGYRLGRDSQDIDVADIVASVDESVDATRCGGKADCQGGEMCLTHELWSDLSDQIHRFLKGVNLASLVQKNQVRAIATKQTLDQYDQIGIQAVQLTD